MNDDEDDKIGKEMFEDLKGIKDEYPKHLLDGTRDEFRMKARRMSRGRRPGCLFVMIAFCIIALVLYILFNWNDLTHYLPMLWLNRGV